MALMNSLEPWLWNAALQYGGEREKWRHDMKYTQRVTTDLTEIQIKAQMESDNEDHGVQPSSLHKSHSNKDGEKHFSPATVVTALMWGADPH